MTNEIPRTPRTKLHRAPSRGSYARDAVDAAIDAALIGHIGYAIDGVPYVTPTACWRDQDHVYWHAADTGRMARHLAGGAPVCVTITHLDALVLARSAFHHSVNYRSVMAFGRAEPVDDPAAKIAALERFVERICPDRWQRIRQPSDAELARTSVFRLRLDEAVLKSRSGPPADDDADLALDVWAGLAPVRTVLDDLVPAPDLHDSPPPPTVSAAIN